MKYLEYREKLVHGTPDFPFAYYNVTPTHPRYSMVYHWHKECEIIRVLSGSILLTLDGVKHKGRAGDIFFLSEGMFHGGTPKDCSYECLVFDLNSVLDDNQISKHKTSPVIQQNNLIQNHFPNPEPIIKDSTGAMMNAMSEKQNGYQFFVLGALYTFLGAVIRYHLYEQPAVNVSSSERGLAQLKKALSLIKSHYHEDLSLEDMAACAGMNKKYFCRFFKQMTERTPVDYLNYYRIESACEQLTMSEKNVSETALSCGFNDVSYFIKVFKKYKNATPMEYVRRK